MGQLSNLQRFVKEEILQSEDLIRNEIEMIKSEISTLITEDAKSGTPIVNGNLLSRIAECITVLEEVQKVMTIQRTKRQLQREYNIAEQAKNESREENKANAEAIFDEAKEKLVQAKNNLEQAKSALYSMYLKKQIKAAIMEGYMIVTLLREALTNETIEYKFLALGQQNGDPVLYESHPKLEEVLRYSILDTTNFSLRLDMTKKQFDKLLQQTEEDSNEEQSFKLKNTVLSQMQRVVDSESSSYNMLQKFLRVKEGLKDIRGAQMNYGQIIEGFETHFLGASDADSTNEINYIYSLLEKGRNNLAYYLGGDIEKNEISYQVKVLSVMNGQRGRVDIATFSNVLTPLKEIQAFLFNLQKGEDVFQAFGEYFKATSETQGDRPFGQGLEKAVKGVIEQSL